MLRFSVACAAMLALAACGDPLRDVQRLSDLDIGDGETTAAALPTGEEIAREGFFGTSAAKSQKPASAPTPAPAPGGLLARLMEGTGTADVAAQGETPKAQDKVAALTPQVQSDAPAAGAFGEARRAPKPSIGPDAMDVSYGSVLPFGQIARVCEARGKALGRKVEKTTARGFSLFDSAPGQTGPRTFYVTGYGDKCPRQFTAANALFGAPSLYEQLRFSGAGTHLPYGETDKAYDRVKSQTCGVQKAKPCGAKLSQLDRSTVFISAYERYDHNARWTEFLVHNGKTLAVALKSLN